MTYSSRLRAKLDPKHPTNRSFPGSSFVLGDDAIEAIYRQRLLAGFDPKRVCPSCNTALPVTGQCDYC
jgi:hypothetical protein